MGRSKKENRKVVGSANDRAVRGEEADRSTEEVAAAGMGLQELPAAAAEGSGGESTMPGDAAPPALSVLDDGCPSPNVVVPSSDGGADGECEPAAAVLTLEQQGAAIRASFKEHTRGKKLLAEGDVAQPAAAVPRAGGVFDAVYTPAENALPLMRYGKGYASESDWTSAVAQDWEERLDDLRVQWAGSGVTFRLFKVG